MFTVLLGALSGIGSIFSTIGKFLGLIEDYEIEQAGETKQQNKDLTATNAQDQEAQKIIDSNKQLSGADLDKRVQQSFTD